MTTHKTMDNDASKAACGANMRGGSIAAEWRDVTCKNCLKRKPPTARDVLAQVAAAAGDDHPVIHADYGVSEPPLVPSGDAAAALLAAPTPRQKHYHLVADLAEALRTWDHRTWRAATKVWLRPDGGQYRWHEVKARVQDSLNDGCVYAPLEKCEGFDPVTGCPGHG
jgi:hypothetical protein